MEDKYFRPAGNLDNNKSDMLYSKKIDSKLTPFRNPGDINVDTKIDKKVLGEELGFKPAGDLIDDSAYKKNSFDDMYDYLLEHVSGKKFDSVCELGVLMDAGRIIIGFEELKRMIDEGYNIVSASVINVEKDMIEVEFQKFVYDEELIERRRRF